MAVGGEKQQGAHYLRTFDVFYSSISIFYKYPLNYYILLQMNDYERLQKISVGLFCSTHTPSVSWRNEVEYPYLIVYAVMEKV